MGDFNVKTGYSNCKNENLAVPEVLQQIKQTDMKCVIFFVSSHYDQIKIAEAINNYKNVEDEYRDVEFIGCTSAGEFTQAGFMEDSITAMSFSSSELAIGIGVGEQISENPIGAAKEAVEKACEELGISVDDLNNTEYTGLVLIDGLRSVEEYIMLGISKIARSLRVAGGSAGDDFNFNRTIIHAQGRTYENAMVLLIFKTKIPVRFFQTSRYLPTTKKLKITKADYENRIVYEFNGRPAADEYAHALGITVDKLDADIFMKHPLALSFEEGYFIRSPQRLLIEERALMFFSHINEGTRVTIMRPGQILQETRDVINKIQQEMPDIRAIISFNCILRYRQSAREGNLSSLIKELSIAPLVGFNTYGEQYNGLHVNQTMTFIVFGNLAIDK